MPVTITNTDTGKEETNIDPDNLFNALTHIIAVNSTPPIHMRWLDPVILLFFGIEKHECYSEKLQMIEIFRELNPDRELFKKIFEMDKHPLKELIDNPYLYIDNIDNIKKYNRSYYIKTGDSCDEIFAGQFLDKITIKFNKPE